MKTVHLLFFAALFMCTTMWLLFDKCNRPSPPQLQPDVIARQDSITKTNEEVQEQLRANQAEMQRQRDSVLKKLEQVKRALIQSEDNTRALAGRIQQPGRKDTIKILEDCNELVDTAVALAERSEAYRKANEHLQQQNDSIEIQYENRLLQQAAFNSQLRQNFSDLNAAFNQQAKTLQKEQRKANKHYTIGIGISGGITTEGKPGGMVGITISRTIIRL